MAHRILIVEDDDSVRFCLGEALRRHERNRPAALARNRALNPALRRRFLAAGGYVALVTCLLLTAAMLAGAQQDSDVPVSAVPLVIEFQGRMPIEGQARPGVVRMTFSVYAAQTGGAPLWMEIQNVQPDANGRFRVQLGSATSGGIPAELFAPGELRWLGVQVESNPELPRTLWVSVPYALKAEEAQRLGGLDAAEFVSVEQLKSAVRQEIQDHISTGTALAIAPSGRQTTTSDPSVGVSSLKDFGAKGDGITDDTAAIQAALSTVNTGTGGALFAPCGIYLISAGLTLTGALDPDRSVRIEGESWRCVTFKANAGNLSVFTMGTFAELENVSIDGNGQTGVNGIYYSGSANSLVRDVHITGVDKGVYMRGSNNPPSGVYFAVLNRVRITNPVYGIYIATVDGGTDYVNQNQFYSCQVLGATADAVYVGGGSGNSFYGLDMEGNNFGFRLLSGMRTTISGAWFEKNANGHLHIAYTARTAGTVVNGIGLGQWAGSVNTSGSIGAGSSRLTVADATNIVGGKVITVNGAGASGGPLVAAVTAVAGQTVTLATLASTTVGPNAAVTGPSFISNSSHFVTDGQYTHLYGTTTIDALQMGSGAASSYYFNQIYGGYQALETPGTNLFQVDYGPNVGRSYWMGSKGNVLLALDTTSGNFAVSGSLQVGGGTPILRHLSVAAPLSVPSIAAISCGTYSVVVSGAHAGDSCALGVPAGWASATNLQFSCAVTATDTVSVKACNVSSTASASLGSGSIRADVWQH